jgi:hypothetical protein
MAWMAVAAIFAAGSVLNFVYWRIFETEVRFLALFTSGLLAGLAIATTAASLSGI